MSHQEKDQTRVAAGLKAAINNPNVSEEAKENASERLQEMGTDVESTSRTRGGGSGGAHSGLEDYKAVVNNVVDLDEAKEFARDFVEGDYDYSRNSGGNSGGQDTIDGKDAGNVLRGYKATLANPRVSDEAKRHAEEKLKEHGAI